MPYHHKKHAWSDPDVASAYDARRFATGLQRAKHRRDVALVLALLERAGGVATVLDLPSGTGRLVPPLRAAGVRVVRADLAAEMLAAGHARSAGGPGPLRPLGPLRPSGPPESSAPSGAAPSPGAVRADAEALPFADGAFDAAVCVRFLHHVDDPPARARALAELARVTRRGVVLQVRLRASAKQASRYLRSRVGLCGRWSPAPRKAELERELADAGLELVELRPVSRLFSDKAFVLARRRG